MTAVTGTIYWFYKRHTNNKKKGKSELSISSISNEEGKRIYSEIMCPLNHNIMVDPVSLNCKHEFSREPIELWLRNNDSCPICRRPARIEDLRGMKGTR